MIRVFVPKETSNQHFWRDSLANDLFSFALLTLLFYAKQNDAKRENRTKEQRRKEKRKKKNRNKGSKKKEKTKKQKRDIFPGFAAFVARVYFVATKPTVLG